MDKLRLQRFTFSLTSGRFCAEDCSVLEWFIGKGIFMCWIWAVNWLVFSGYWSCWMTK